MSVIVAVTLKVDPAALQQLFASKADIFTSIAERAQKVGALHHRFLAGHGQVIILDEWDSTEAFQEFFTNQPEIAALMRDAGVEGPPEIQVWQPIEGAPDTF
ncbi:hypothetical protein ThrDRAFT_02899 [Frankia casuarinae]|jgi:quinol monooxygenase YgiN|uniref:ABM domain-containing protein n=1 Tax=Frankia casuarinae (strain DSM 45818 / CECT 9043 / HFP020203 / CcI3) TaxID=106370 RepID=Q2J7H1_FRACC|nr:MULTISPECIES: hypothetical protein [Frankia]ABD12771.1 hypothetical protein Francci3_3417 [Frankia casuarinae]ETA01025.1 hypothetical protein CcI6DRAFT_03565 [Frankia sp. CcI6]EYT91469.1 hypothetical protein ThrDRAFT_02899 [Frankia casuarinae]KDA41888.1 hypothetical protein BMG523Draft_03278 [Frankia sp. BMG5.23]KEZ37096.1 hypothetical protein CEDDRAFT_01624 [Frankia sp. CeD]